MTVGTIDQIMPRSHSVNTMRMPAQTLFSVPGKSIGKDAASEKSTFPSLLGLEECRELAAKLTEEAVDAVKPLDGHAFLVELARSLTGRTK